MRTVASGAYRILLVLGQSGDRLMTRSGAEILHVLELIERLRASG